MSPRLPPMSDSRVIIRPPSATDCEAFLEAVQRSANLHLPWIHAPLTPADYRLYLERFQPDDHESRLVCLADTGELVGVINLSNIIRGYFQNSFLGFYAFLPHAAHGYMSDGLRLVIREAFDTLNLHRLEANIQPANHRSINLVKKAGFRWEGLSPRYLRIDGTWKDHERWALLSDEAQSRPTE